MKSLELWTHLNHPTQLNILSNLDTYICCCFLGFFLGEGPTSSTAPVLAFNPASPVVEIVTWGPDSIPWTSGSCLIFKEPALDGVGTVSVLTSEILLSTECWLLESESLENKGRTDNHLLGHKKSDTNEIVFALNDFMASRFIKVHFAIVTYYCYDIDMYKISL